MTDVEAGATATEDTEHEAAAETAESPSEVDASQDVLTQSVGQRLTRGSHDTQQPRWKRWLGRS
jgi:hypothetical protein